MRSITALLFASTIVAAPGALTAQTARPYSIDDIINYLAVPSMTADKIFAQARRSCIDFKVTSSVEARLRSAGASDVLITGLRSVCYKGSAPVVDPPRKQDPPRKVVEPTRKVIPPRRVVDTVYVPQRVDPPVIVPTVVNNTNGVVWDFASTRPISPYTEDACSYDYSGGAFVARVIKAGLICTTGGTSGNWTDQVRIAATARGMSGGVGYSYGIWFGYQNETIPYFVFDVSEGGSFSLKEWLPERMRNGSEWRDLISWQASSAIYTAASGMANRLAVEINGSSARLFVNGTQVGSYNLPERPLGHAGFGIFAHDRLLALPVVAFTRFSVTPTAGGGGVSNVVDAGTPVIDWDLAGGRPISESRDANCDYAYASGGFQITVITPGLTCIENSTLRQQANIRVTATGRPLRGGNQFFYGLRIGYNADSTIMHYVFEITDDGYFRLERNYLHQWQAVVPLTRSYAINTFSSGLPNTVVADVRGTSMTFTVNGQVVSRYEAAYPPYGEVGFGISGYNNSAPPTVVFTRFTVAPLIAR